MSNVTRHIGPRFNTEKEKLRMINLNSGYF